MARERPRHAADFSEHAVVPHAWLARTKIHRSVREGRSRSLRASDRCHAMHPARLLRQFELPITCKVRMIWSANLLMEVCLVRVRSWSVSGAFHAAAKGELFENCPNSCCANFLMRMRRIFVAGYASLREKWRTLRARCGRRTCSGCVVHGGFGRTPGPRRRE